MNNRMILEMQRAQQQQMNQSMMFNQRLLSNMQNQAQYAAAQAHAKKNTSKEKEKEKDKSKNNNDAVTSVTRPYEPANLSNKR